MMLMDGERTATDYLPVVYTTGKVLSSKNSAQWHSRSGVERNVVELSAGARYDGRRAGDRPVQPKSGSRPALPRHSFTFGTAAGVDMTRERTSSADFPHSPPEHAPFPVTRVRACQVDDLIRTAGVLEHFRKQIEVCRMIAARYWEAKEGHRALADKHLDDPDFKEEVPPVESLPPSPFPNPMNDDDNRRPKPGQYLPGYYWILAVIHDRMLPERPAIIDTTGDLPVLMRLHVLHDLDMLMGFTEFSCDHLDFALKDVQDDLGLLAGQGAGAETGAKAPTGGEVTLGSGEQGAMKLEESAYSHSEDFTSCRWNGQLYQFRRTQADCIAVLWKAWEAGTPCLRQLTIGERIESADDHFRLDKVFRSHPAWGVMIQSAGRGIYKLA